MGKLTSRAVRGRGGYTSGWDITAQAYSMQWAKGLHIRDHNCPPSARDPKKLAKAKFWWVVGLEQEQVRGCCPEPVFKGDRDFRLLIHSCLQGGSIATPWLVSCEFCKIKYIKSICTGPIFSHLFLRKLDPQIYILICVQLSPPHWWSIEAWYLSN